MRILFITANRVGDAVLTTGLLKYLVNQYPNARFTIACGPVAADLFKFVPNVERIVVMRKGRWMAHWRQLLLSAITTPWWMVVDMRGSAIAWILITARRRIYFRRNRLVHRIEDMRHTLRLTEPQEPYVWLGAENHAFANNILGAENDRPLLIIGPTANWNPKIWPAERFVSLINELTSAGSVLNGARIAVVGGPGEEPVARPILSSIPTESRIDLVGPISLLNVGAVINRGTLYVGNDSGLMHLSASTRCPTLGLFGPTREENYRPWGPHCSYVRTDQTFYELQRHPDYRPLTDQSLMEGLSVERVLHAAKSLLKQTQINK